MKSRKWVHKQEGGKAILPPIPVPDFYETGLKVRGARGILETDSLILQQWSLFLSCNSLSSPQGGRWVQGTVWYGCPPGACIPVQFASEIFYTDGSLASAQSMGPKP